MAPEAFVTTLAGMSAVLCSPLDGTVQLYTLPRIVIAVIIDPSLRMAA